MANYDLTYEGSRVQGILDTGNSLKDAGYIFRGEATPSTVPGTPTERVAYIGGPGTYTNFGSSITVGAGCICVFKYTGSAWSNQVIDTGLSNGYVYAGVATPSTSPVTGKVFYLAVQAGTYTNFGNAVVTAGLNVLKKNGSAWSVDQVIAIDAEPTQGSANLVKSGGVLNSIIQNGPAFDISAYNAQGGVLATYADLSAALTALNALPADFKKGGMSMKFVLSSDNKYVQYRLMANSFSTTESDWQGVDDEPTAGSDNLVKSGGVKKAFGNIEYYDAIVDYSAQGYNRILLNTIPLYVKSTDLYLDLVNETGVVLIIRLFYSEDDYDSTMLSQSRRFHFHNANGYKKIFAYFASAAQPQGKVSITLTAKPSAYYTIIENEKNAKKSNDNTNNLVRQKADIDVGVNLVNPDTVQVGYYINTSGAVIPADSDSYRVSDYIPVKGQNIKSNCLVRSFAASYAVYDENFNLLRTIVNDSTQYTFVDGDEYIRIGFDATSYYANYGSVLQTISYTKFAHYDAIAGQIERLPLGNIINGIKNICVTAEEMNINESYYEAIDKDSFIYKSLKTTASTWCASKIFQPNLSLPVRIRAKATLLQGTVRDFNLWVSPSWAYDSQKTTNYKSFVFPAGVNEIDIDFSFDPQYFVVYKGFTTDFSIWLQSKGDGTTVTKIQFDDFAIYQTVGEEIFNNFSGSNLPEILHSIDTALPTDVDVAEDENIKVSPNGNKFVLQVANSGDIITIPVIPSKAHYFGNSLLSGNTFGMAASDQYHDYYYLINNYILSKNASYVSDKHSVADFERAASLSDARTLIQTLVGYLSGDEDLIFIQIGDNVSEQNLQNVFSTSFKELVLAIRNECQTARIIIFGCWYSSTARIELLSQVAKETGCLFINITDLNIIANQSFIGAIQKRTYSSTWTLENVTSVVDNGEVHTGYAHNITVTFTVSGFSYTATVDSTSYTLDGTTLQYTSDYYIIPNRGVGSHPGDNGFKAIVNRVLYKTGMVDVENYIN